MSWINILKSKFEVDIQSGLANLNKAGEGLKGFGIISKKLRRDIDTLAHSFQALGGIKDAFNWGYDKLGGVTHYAFEANKNFENLQRQLTSLIAVNSQNIDSMGRSITISQKWAMSGLEAKKTIEKLNETNLKTKFTLDEVASAFQNFYAVSSNQGSRSKAVEAFDSIAMAVQATGADMSSLTTMFDSLATGTITASSEMGKFIRAVGLSNEELKEANKQGKVFDLLIEKLAKFKDMSDLAATGWDVATGNLENELTELSKILGKPMFDTLTSAVENFSKFLSQNRDEITRYADAAKDAAKSVGFLVASFYGARTAILAKNSALRFSISLLPAFESKTKFATASIKLFTNALNLAKSAIFALFPVVLLDSFMEYKNIQSQINDETRTAQIEVSTYSILVAEAGRDIMRGAELAYQGYMGYFHTFEFVISSGLEALASHIDKVLNFLIDRINSVSDGLTKFSNTMSGLIGLDPISGFKIGKSNMGDFFAKNTEYFRENALSYIDKMEKTFNDIAINTTREEIEKRNREIFEANRKAIQDTKEQAAKLVNSTGGSSSSGSGKSKEELEKLAREEAERLRKRASIYHDYYEKIGEYAKAWAIEEERLRKEYKDLGFSNEEAEKFIQTYKNEYLNKFTKNAKEAFGEIKDSWQETIMSMAKAVEDNFFNFFTGKISSFSKMLKQLGKDIMSAFISPYAKKASEGLGSLFGSLLGANEGSKTSVSKLASSLGLTLANGVYAGEVNGTAVKLDSVGNIMQGNSAFGGAGNILSLASNMSSVSKLFSGNSGIIETFKGIGTNLSSIGSSLFNPATYKTLFTNLQGSLFGSISGVFGDLAGYSYQLFGNAALATGIANFGTNFGSALTFGEHITGGFAGGLGTIAGASLLGYGGGRILSGLGDRLFKADTYASKYGSMAGLAGGAIGGLGASLGAFGSFAGPIGAAVGAVLGAVIGGFRGKTKVKDSGLEAFNDFLITKDGIIGDEIKNFIDKQKKSWVKKKSWTEYSKINQDQRDSINKMLSSTYSTLSLADANLDEFRIKSGKWSKGEGLTDGVKFGVVRAMMSRQDVDNYAKTWKDLESTLKAVSEVGTYRGQIEAMSKNNPVTSTKFQTQLLNKTLNAGLGSVMNLDKFGGSIKEIGELKAKEFLEIYNKSIKENFTPENVELWKNLSDTYKQATEAARAYTKTLIDYTKTIYEIMGNYYASIGKSVDFTPNVLNEQLGALRDALKFDLNENEKKALGAFNFADLNKFFNSLDDKNLRAFLENGDFELRSELLRLTTSYNEYLKKSLEASLGGLDEIKNTIIENTKKAFSENLQVLKKQSSLIDRLNSLATKLRDETSSDMKFNYEFYLKRARDEYKAGNFDSSVFEYLEKAASNYAADIKATSTDLREYRFKILKLAGEVDSIGAADKINVEKTIKEIEILLGNTSATLESSRLEIIRLNENSTEQIKTLEKLLGSDNPMVKALKNLILASIKIDSIGAKKELENLGVREFADGGIVTKKTNAIIGEAGYPEAVIPLKGGKGLKVDMGNGFERLVDKMDRMEQILKAMLMNDNNKLRILRTADTGDGLKVVS